MHLNVSVRILERTSEIGRISLVTEVLFKTIFKEANWILREKNCFHVFSKLQIRIQLLYSSKVLPMATLLHYV